MKRFITLFSLVVLFGFNSFSQCEPNPAYTIPGIYPDSATGFPPAVATYPYELVITAVIPEDTIVYPFPRLPIDSIGVFEIEGLPEGFEAIPNTPSGYWHGGTSGCMLVTGTPTMAQVGEYPLTIKVVGYMGGLGLPFPYDITFYSITVLDSVLFAIPGLERQINAGLRAYPNPFSDHTNIEFHTVEPGDYELLVYDSRNRLVHTKQLIASQGRNQTTLNLADLGKGVYICIIRNQEKTISAATKLLKY